MEYFHIRFPDVAGEETRAVTLSEHPGIEDGEYAFFESFCNEKVCDCRRVLINVVS